MSPNKFDQEGVLRLKIVLVLVYLVFIVAILVITSGSAEVLIQQLTLQLGSIVSDAVSDTSEAP